MSEIATTTPPNKEYVPKEHRVSVACHGCFNERFYTYDTRSHETCCPKCGLLQGSISVPLDQLDIKVGATVFAVTTVDSKKQGKTGSKRTLGIFTDMEKAMKPLDGNWGDIHEGNFDLAVVEETPVDGIYPLPTSEHWFRWNDVTGRYEPCEKPEEFENAIGWGIG